MSIHKPRDNDCRNHRHKEHRLQKALCVSTEALLVSLFLLSSTGVEIRYLIADLSEMYLKKSFKVCYLIKKGFSYPGFPSRNHPSVPTWARPLSPIPNECLTAEQSELFLSRPPVSVSTGRTAARVSQGSL